jgi:Tol biopolymer transport system component
MPTHRAPALRSALKLFGVCALALSCAESHAPPSAGGVGDAPDRASDAGRPKQEKGALSPPARALDAGGSSLSLDTADEVEPSSDGCVARSFPIAFVSTRAPPTAEYELYVMTEDGSEVRRVGRGGHFTNPVWSPDGASIAFHHVSPTLQSYIGVIDPDDATGVQLSPLTTYLRPSDVGSLPDGPSWSADGKTLAFAAPESETFWRIYLMARTGGEGRLLLPELERSHAHPSFAKHDTRLAYVMESDAGSDLWVVDTNEPTRSENLTQGRVERPEWPRWSPDDTRIVFSALEREPLDAGGGDSEIFVLTLATGAITQLTHDVAFDRHPTWSPDGESVLYSSRRDCATVDDCNDLWRLPLDGAPALQLSTTAREYFPDWYGGAACASPR